MAKNLNGGRGTVHKNKIHIVMKKNKGNNTQTRIFAHLPEDRLRWKGRVTRRDVVLTDKTKKEKKSP